jgi:hypothetical protein
MIDNSKVENWGEMEFVAGKEIEELRQGNATRSHPDAYMTILHP